MKKNKPRKAKWLVCDLGCELRYWDSNSRAPILLSLGLLLSLLSDYNEVTIALISNGSKIMLKILQARLKQYMNCELADVQAGFRKGRGTRNQIVNICWIIEKQDSSRKNIYFCFDCVDQNRQWKILKDLGMPDHLTCLLRNPYAGQEATVRTGHGTTDWFQIGKEYVKAVYCHPAYLTSMQSTS